MKRVSLRVPVALLLFALALFFRFALLGYGVTALLLAALALVLLVYELCERKGLRRLRTGLTCLLCLGLLTLIALEIPIVRASRGSEDDDAAYCVVLGAGVNGTTPSLSMVERLRAALDWLERHPEGVAVVSGGQGAGESVTEAEAMAVWLTANGVDPARILREEQASSTWENLRYSFDLIRQQGDDPASGVAVVSSEYHLYRAHLMAEKLGVEVSTVPARTSLPILRRNYFLREAFAVAYLRVFGA